VTGKSGSSEPGGDGRGAGQALTFPHLVKWVEMAVRSRVDRALRGMPVSSSQLFVLVLLDEQGEATSAELARRMHLTPQAMTTLLAPLRDGGLISRRSDSTHGRKLHLRLTAEGVELLSAVRELTPPIEDELLSSLSALERATLKDLLARVVAQFGG
jgi:DNA-binding MarR family transcriptional regulator